MERVTINLTNRGSDALEKAIALTGDSKTDCVNRALPLFAYIQEALSKGGSVTVQEERGGESVRLMIL